uniref:TIL domain-containing protein n=1 Tax=Strongyloides stercoralis TaxID=6248 RepID=A0A0K0EB10_STRER
MQIKLVFLISILFLTYISYNEARKRPKQCRKHMIYKMCTKTCPKTCDKNENKGKRCFLDCKHPGCECKRGYVLAKKNKCVRKSKCHKYRTTTKKPTTTMKMIETTTTASSQQCLGNNTEYTDCLSSCPLKCSDITKVVPCTANCNGVGCQCKQGYYLNKKNECISKTKCIKDPEEEVCPPNSEYSFCKSLFTRTCSYRFLRPRRFSLRCAGEGCQCKHGYYYKNGKCITAEECDATTTSTSSTRSITTTTTKMIETTTTASSQQCLKNNTVYTECLSACPLKCSDITKSAPCTANCNGVGCQCKPGYYLNKNNECISFFECINDPKEEVCPQNSKYTFCRSFCFKSCSNRNLDEIGCNIPKCAGAGCQCEKGYYYNNGKCLTLEECDKLPTTTEKPTMKPTTTTKMIKTTTTASSQQCLGNNTEYTDCLSSCPLKCSDITKSDKCAVYCNGPGCQCKEGYFLNKKNECVSITECVKDPEEEVCPPNMVYKFCRSYCPSTCSDRFLWFRPCKLMCKPPGCQCKSGYYLNKEGKCVTSSECDATTTTTLTTTITTTKPTPVCPTNMVYTLCKSACQPKCWEKERNWCIFMCAGVGCECRKPFALNHKGECVERHQCPVYKSTTTRRPTTTPVCPANMVYTKCKSSCPPKCTDKEGEPKICTFNCDGEGCECRAPFALDSEGNCIKKSECTISTTTAKPSRRRFLLYYTKKTFQSLLSYIYQK